MDIGFRQACTPANFSHRGALKTAVGKNLFGDTQYQFLTASALVVETKFSDCFGIAGKQISMDIGDGVILTEKRPEFGSDIGVHAKV